MAAEMTSQNHLASSIQGPGSELRCLGRVPIRVNSRAFAVKKICYPTSAFRLQPSAFPEDAPAQHAIANYRQHRSWELTACRCPSSIQEPASDFPATIAQFILLTFSFSLSRGCPFPKMPLPITANAQFSVFYGAVSMVQKARMTTHLRIKDLPDAERPRERLLLHGADALRNSELVAILLRTGMKKVSRPSKSPSSSCKSSAPWKTWPRRRWTTSAKSKGSTTKPSP